MALSGDSNEAISLPIMPMLDIFSILVTFLLMSYSSDPISHDPNPALTLPDSITTVSLDEVPAVVVSKHEILVNDNKVLSITDGIDDKDTTQGAIYPLYQELVKLNTTNSNYSDAQAKDDSKVSTLTLEMDREHKFELMRMVMLSAQQAKFVTFKLVVSKEKARSS
ncbi:MAG: biopolymer transporter ExbD [Pseudomonadota bacterium]|nr:biopolymer transporter ExbD [Pseudomonadota bacterium]